MDWKWYRGYQIRIVNNSAFVYDTLGFFVLAAETVDDAQCYIDCLIEEEEG